MRKQNGIILILLLLLIFFYADQAKSQGKKNNIITIGFYNVENLFDTIDDPVTDDQEFTPSGSNKWDSRRYNLKLQR